MHRFLILWAIILFGALAPFNANAQDADDNQLVKIRLLAERNNVSGGDEIWIGIDKSIEPHWHTYWINPGDSGTETRTEWTLPEGASISPIYWPAPQRIPYGPLMNYGYEDNITLLQKIKLPETLPEGPITLSADIELLVCKEECIPEYGTYTLTLNDTNAPAEDNTAFFENAATQIPLDVDWNSAYSHNDGAFELVIELPSEISQDINTDTITLFPRDWGLVENAKAQSAILDKNTLTITQQSAERDPNSLKTSDFVLSYSDKQGRQFHVSTTGSPLTKTSTVASLTKANPDQETQEQQSNSNITILSALIYALLGGMVLNLMPCVFPVLSIKALSLVKIADKSPALAKMHGLSYTAGVVLSFIAIAAALLILKSAGAQIGWGFQLQNPIVVGALAYLLFIVGLNLMGYFEFGNRLGNVGNKLTQNQGLNGSFFTGVLATIVATPCTAPFMAAAIGFALTQSAIVNLSVFAALGFGLALPYLALSCAPALQRIMPKPGAWMNTFKELLAFPIFLSAIWLVWVLSKQAGSTGVLQILIGMSTIGFGIWLLRKASEKIVLKAIAILSFIIAGFMLIIPTTPGNQNQTSITEEIKSEKFGEVFSPATLNNTLRDSDNAVFVEMTAAWCITCKLNHAVGINIENTKKAFLENNVHYYIGDWTNQDPQITEYLNSFGRNGVPIYVFYDEKNQETGERPEPKVLPQILTPVTLKNLFED